MNVIVTEEAEESIRDIIEFLATKNPAGAQNVYDAISLAIDRLDQLSEMWPRVSVKFDMRKRIVTDYPQYSIYFPSSGKMWSSRSYTMDDRNTYHTRGASKKTGGVNEIQNSWR